MRPRPTLVPLVLAATALVALSACEKEASRPTPSGQASVADTAGASESSAGLPLSLAAHVLAPGAIPGFTAKRPLVQSPVAFAKAHDKSVAELQAAGMVRGVTLTFRPPAEEPGAALSIAVEYASTAQADTEAARLFASNAKPDKGTTATEIAVDGLGDEGRAVRLTGQQRSRPFTGIEVVWVDGVIVHEVFAIGLDPLVSVDEILNSVRDLQAAVADHPLAP